MVSILNDYFAKIWKKKKIKKLNRYLCRKTLFNIIKGQRINNFVYEKIYNLIVKYTNKFIVNVFATG